MQSDLTVVHLMVLNKKVVQRLVYYELYSVIKRDNTYLVFDEKYSKKVFLYFLSSGKNSTDDKFLQYVELKAVAQEKLKESDLDKCDFLESTSHYPIFSERFYSTFFEILAQDAIFHPVKVQCNT